jgi:UDP-GlcNAc:undecaprenyl-phosphate GlcNAc-1-phosphate transferase
MEQPLHTGIFFSLAAAFLLSLLLMPLAVRLGRVSGLMDLPDRRKVHKSPVPRSGGLVLVAGALLPLFLLCPMDSTVAGYFLGVSVLALFGLADDLKDIDYKLKFLGQIAAALLFVLVSGKGIVTAGEVIPGHVLDLGWLSVPVSVLFLVAAVNVLNLIDGLDALAGGVTLLMLACTAILALAQGSSTLLLLAAGVAGVVLGFLVYNVHPARIFMGDTGSQFLGFSVGVFMILLTQGQSIYSPVLPLFLIGVPVIDTAGVMARRIATGHNPFKPDRNHLHHKLLRLGFSHPQSVLFIYLLQLGFALTGILLSFAQDFLLLAVYLGLAAVFLGFMKSDRLGHVPSRAIIKVLHAASRLVPASVSDGRARAVAARLSWVLFLAVFSGLFLLAPYPTQDIGIRGVLLALSVAAVGLSVIGAAPPLALRISVYAILTTTIFVLEEAPIAPGRLPLGMSADDALFLVLAALYVCCLVFTAERPLDSLDFLLVFVVILLFFAPGRYFAFEKAIEIFAKGVLVVLCINLIFARLGANRGYLMSLNCYYAAASIAVFLAAELLGRASVHSIM